VFYTARRSGLRGRKLVYIAATAIRTWRLRAFFAFFFARCLVHCLRNGTQIYVHFTPDLRICAQPFAPYACYTQPYAWVRQFHTPLGTQCLCIRHTPYAIIRQPTQILRLFHENAAGVRRSTRIISKRVRGTTQLYAGPV